MVRSKPARQPGQQPNGGEKPVSVPQQSAVVVNGQQQPKRKQQQQQTEEADQAQPRAKQKLKITAKQRGDRAAVPVDVTATTAGAASCGATMHGGHLGPEHGVMHARQHVVDCTQLCCQMESTCCLSHAETACYLQAQGQGSRRV